MRIAVSRSAPTDHRRQVTPLRADASNAVDLDAALRGAKSAALSGHDGAAEAAVLAVRAAPGQEEAFIAGTPSSMSSNSLGQSDGSRLRTEHENESFSPWSPAECP